jgi:hypothetical protein
MERKGEQRQIHSEPNNRRRRTQRTENINVSARACAVSERIEYVPDTFQMSRFTALLHSKK